MDRDCKHANGGAGTGEGAQAFLMLKEVNNREHLKNGTSSSTVSSLEVEGKSKGVTRSVALNLSNAVAL